MTRLAAFVLAVNAAYLIGNHNVAGRGVGAAGCVSALIILLLAMSFKPRPATWAIVAGAFALPLLSGLAPVTIAFWQFDARGSLIVAWLITVSCLLWEARRGSEPSTDKAYGTRPYGTWLTLLFIAWSSAFWLSVVWDVGVGHAVLNNGRDDRISLTFRLWQTTRPSQHLFLMWLTPEDFAGHVAYTNHLHPYMFSLYGVVRLIQLTTGATLNVARNLIPFATAAAGVVAFTFVLLRSRWFVAPPAAKALASLFLGLGLFLTEWHFWVSFYTTNLDDAFPLIVFLMAILFAAAAPGPERADKRLLIASAVAFGAFGWVYTPLAVAALWCYYGRFCPGTEAIRRNRALISASLACGITGAIALVVPRMLVAVKGYGSVSSSFVFRSGLDGDTRFFHDMAQAILRPFYGDARTWWTMFFPGLVPVVVWLTWGTAGATAARRRLARALLVLVSPYLFSVALFPQSVSIHPYLYDHFLFMPAALLGGIWALAPSVQRRVRGPAVLALLLLFAALLMANLVAIAQGVRTTPVA
jgi:hypothetical protein